VKHPQYGIDLHVHTRRFSPCAELLDPERIADTMRDRGIQGVVVAEHDALWPAADIAVLNRHFNGHSRIYRGVEVSCDIGHFVTIGLGDRAPIYPGMSVSELVAVAEDAGAAVIVVHPHVVFRKTGRSVDITALPDGLHAVEVLSTQTYGESSTAALSAAKSRRWSPVAGSDAHCLEQIGAAVTVFDHLPADEAALAIAIRRGAGKPMRHSRC